MINIRILFWSFLIIKVLWHPVFFSWPYNLHLTIKGNFRIIEWLHLLINSFIHSASYWVSAGYLTRRVQEFKEVLNMVYPDWDNTARPLNTVSSRNKQSSLRPDPSEAIHKLSDPGRCSLPFCALDYSFIKWAHYYLLTVEQVRIVWVNNVKHSAQDLGHKNQAGNNSCYYKLQEHFELMAGPSVANGCFVWLFFVSFCRGQILHVLMSFVAARGWRTDACLVLCGVWSWAIVHPASLQLQAWQRT